MLSGAICYNPVYIDTQSATTPAGGMLVQYPPAWTSPSFCFLHCTVPTSEVQTTTFVTYPSMQAEAWSPPDIASLLSLAGFPPLHRDTYFCSSTHSYSYLCAAFWVTPPCWGLAPRSAVVLCDHLARVIFFPQKFPLPRARGSPLER